MALCNEKVFPGCSGNKEEGEYCIKCERNTVHSVSIFFNTVTDKKTTTKTCTVCGEKTTITKDTFSNKSGNSSEDDSSQSIFGISGG